MGCYVKSQGCGNETYDVMKQKEINKNLTTWKCSSLSFDEEQSLYRFYETNNVFFSFQIANSHSQKLRNWLKWLNAPNANHYKHANPKMQIS